MTSRGYKLKLKEFKNEKTVKPRRTVMSMEMYHGDEDWVDWDPTETEQVEYYFLEESKINNEPIWVGG